MDHTKILALVFCLFLVACNTDDDTPNTLDINEEAAEELGVLPDEIFYPESNPYSEAKAELGRLLFWDPILSGDFDVSCATCHHPDKGYADAVERSLGVGGVGLAEDRLGGTLIARNSPTVINTGYNGITLQGDYTPESAPMFWDNRSLSLEVQAIQPILSAEEMKGEHFSDDEILIEVIHRLQGVPEYVALFSEAFGSEGISIERVGEAIATFERGITAGNSRYDQYMRGNEDALTNFELEGLDRFLDAGCADCHSGPMFSDFELHTLGVPNNGINDMGATGAYEFRTPTLRNIELTAPYMHNGIFNDLDDVVEFYEDIADGDEDDINNNIDLDDIADEARDLDLDGGDVNEIVAFLRTLTDEDFDKGIPASVPSGLPVGGDIQ